MTYWYILTDPLFKKPNKTLFSLDKFIVGDPHKYFDGPAVKCWGHKNDETGAIDIDTSFGFGIDKL